MTVSVSSKEVMVDSLTEMVKEATKHNHLAEKAKAEMIKDFPLGRPEVHEIDRFGRYLDLRGGYVSSRTKAVEIELKIVALKSKALDIDLYLLRELMELEKKIHRQTAYELTRANADNDTVSLSGLH